MMLLRLAVTTNARPAAIAKLRIASPPVYVKLSGEEAAKLSRRLKRGIPKRPATLCGPIRLAPPDLQLALKSNLAF